MLPTKQSFWDKPGLTRDSQTVENSKIEAGQRAQFLAASADHSGDWLLALPVASCGLRLDDEAVRVAVSIRLGLNLGALTLAAAEPKSTPGVCMVSSVSVRRAESPDTSS